MTEYSDLSLRTQLNGNLKGYIFKQDKLEKLATHPS